jgi:hypothetical protein
MSSGLTTIGFFFVAKKNFKPYIRYLRKSKSKNCALNEQLFRLPNNKKNTHFIRYKIYLSFITEEQMDCIVFQSLL